MTVALSANPVVATAESTPEPEVPPPPAPCS
jgi:hypothetical protein